MTNRYMLDEANMDSGFNEFNESSQGTDYMLESKVRDDKSTWEQLRLDGGGWYL